MRKPEYYTKKLFFGLLKLLSGKSSKSKVQPSFGERRNILLIRLNNIGDALVTTPLIEQLKNKIYCNIDILCHRRNSVVFENNKSVDNIFILEKGFFNFFRMLFRARRKKYYCIVDTHNDVSATANLFLLLLKSEYRFGFRKEENNLYTGVIEKPDSAKTHIAEQILHLLKLFGVEPDLKSVRIVYDYSNESSEFAADYLERNFPEKKFLIGINLFAGSTARYWGTENFLKLLNFLERYPVNIILIAPEKLPADIDELAGRAPVFRNDFDKLAALISKLDLLITPDTSVIHLASAYGVAVFGLYVHYNTDEMIWKPYGADFEYVVTEEATLAGVRYEEAEGKLKGFLEVRIVDFTQRGDSIKN